MKENAQTQSGQVFRQGFSAGALKCGLKCRSIRPADSSQLLNDNHLALCDFQAIVDTALESSASALSNAVSTRIWELRSGEWSTRNSELVAARIMLRPRRCIDTVSRGLSTALSHLDALGSTGELDVT